MVRLNSEAIAEHEARNAIKSVVVLLDSLNGEAAVYVDGKFNYSDSLIDAFVIAKACNGSACMLVTREVDAVDDWPEDLSYFDDADLP